LTGSGHLDLRIGRAGVDKRLLAANGHKRRPIQASGHAVRPRNDEALTQPDFAALVVHGNVLFDPSSTDAVGMTDARRGWAPCDFQLDSGVGVRIGCPRPTLSSSGRKDRGALDLWNLVARALAGLDTGDQPSPRLPHKRRWSFKPM
jgi:hypothetical protein